MSNNPTPAQTNAANKAKFLDAAVKRSQKLSRQKFDYSNGTPSTMEFKLPHAGFARYVLLDVDATLTISGSGGTLAMPQRNPYSLFNRVKFEDYLGITRINVPAYTLYERLIGQHYAFDPSNSALAQGYSTDRYNVSIGGTGGAAGTYPLKFTVLVPVSIHEDDTQGTFPFTVPNGDNVISLEFVNTLVGSTNEAFLNQSASGFTVTLSGSVGATYYYWDVPKGTPLPTLDMSLVHELRYVKNLNVLGAGDEYRYTLRTGRTYYQVIQNVVIDDVLDTTDLTDVAFYVDGNTSTLDETLVGYLERIYRQNGRDFPPGMIEFSFWDKPWTPGSYGSLETSVTLSGTANVTGTSYTEVFMESMYKTSKIINDLNQLNGVAG